YEDDVQHKGEYEEGLDKIADQLIAKYKNNFGEFEETIDGIKLIIESRKEFKTKDGNILVADELEPTLGDYYMAYRYKNDEREASLKKKAYDIDSNKIYIDREGGRYVGMLHSEGTQSQIFTASDKDEAMMKAKNADPDAKIIFIDAKLKSTAGIYRYSVDGTISYEHQDETYEIDYTVDFDEVTGEQNADFNVPDGLDNVWEDIETKIIEDASNQSIKQSELKRKADDIKDPELKQTVLDIEKEHKPTMDKIKKDVNEDGRVDISDKEVYESIGLDHGVEVNPENPEEGVKEYYDKRKGLPEMEKRLEGNVSKRTSLSRHESRQNVVKDKPLSIRDDISNKKEADGGGGTVPLYDAKLPDGTIKEVTPSDIVLKPIKDDSGKTVIPTKYTPKSLKNKIFPEMTFSKENEIDNRQELDKIVGGDDIK
ncbi:hypothetical protein LCGC14_2733280, partial [marine sediment metagenome]